jgi:hypothetical protein
LINIQTKETDLSRKMSATKNDTEGWVQAGPKPKQKSNSSTNPNKTWSIDRKQQRKPSNRQDGNVVRSKKIVKEKIPDAVADMLVTEFLTLVGDSDWNDPANVSKTIANMMSIDLTKPIDDQVPRSVEIDRTVFVAANKGSDVPYWICQSIIRVDEKCGNRFIDYKGAKYNKIDIIFGCDYFKQRMDEVAKAAHCTWNARWGNASKEENRLYQKTRTGAQSDESWLERGVKHLLTDADVGGINIKNLVMIEFKRDLRLLKAEQEPELEPQVVTQVVTKIEKPMDSESESEEEQEQQQEDDDGEAEDGEDGDAE